MGWLPVAYTWDNNGNLLNDGVNTYTYDSANRLIAFNGTSSYAYNGLGDRLSQTVNGNTTNYTLDLNAGLTQVLNDGTNSYLYGNGRIAQTQGTVTEYFLGDALGSVRQLTDASGDLTLAKSYAPYGEVANSAGSAVSPFAFTGEQQDVSGLTYLHARYYSSGDGRFLTRDTWMGDYNRPLSLNRWMYVEGNPVNLTDPSGMCVRPDGSIDFWGKPIGWWLPCIKTGQPSTPATSTPQPPTSTSTPTSTPTLTPTSTYTPSPTCTPTFTPTLTSTPTPLGTIAGFPNITISNPQDWSSAEIAGLTSALNIMLAVFGNSPSKFANAVGNISVAVVPDNSLTVNGKPALARSPFNKINFEHRIFSPLNMFGIIHEFGHQFDWQGHESNAQKLQWRSQQFVDNPAINLNFAQCTDRLQCRNIYRDQNNGGQIYFPTDAYANAFAAYILGPSSPIKYQAEKLTIIQNDIQGVP